MAGKKERNGAMKNSEREIAKKNWLIRMHEINIWCVFEPDLREIYLFGKNNVFFFSKS